VNLFSHLRLRLSRAVRAFEANPEQSEPNQSSRTFTVSLERDPLDGGWVAECLDLPGCVSQGETQHEALENILDAIAEVLAVRMEQQLPTDTDSPDGEDSRRVALTV
jgi:predicted RNase H-like HicB family nuclease